MVVAIGWGSGSKDENPSFLLFGFGSGEGHNAAPLFTPITIVGWMVKWDVDVRVALGVLSSTLFLL